MSTKTNSPLPPHRTPARARLFLALTALLFCAWIGWLAYLALTVTRPITLSRPQFLSSHLDVIAKVAEGESGPASPVEVVEVLWSRDPQLRPQPGQKLLIPNLPQTKKKDGWDGPGSYILPLVKDGDTYALAPLGASPGFSGIGAPPRIYRLTRDTLAQHKQIRGAQ